MCRLITSLLPIRSSLPLLLILIIPVVAIAQGIPQERVLIGRDIRAIDTVLRAHGVPVLGTIDEIGARRFLATNNEARRIELALAGAASIDSQPPRDMLIALMSGPSSVPTINPAGTVGAIQSQPTFFGISMFFPWSTAQQAGPIVAIIDTGIDTTHGDLESSISPWSRDFLEPGTAPDDTANGLDDDGDGVIDPAFGHGTHLAGLVLAGCPMARLMALRVVDDEGRTDTWLVARAIVHAVKNGAAVIELAMGLSGHDPTLEAAIDWASNADVLIVTSAGNDTCNVAPYPAAHPATLVIGATDPGPASWLPLSPVYPNETIASFSNYGFVDFALMGINVKSTYPGDRYAEWSGTSMTSATFAGLAALALHFHPNLDRASLTSLFELFTVDVMSGHLLGDDALGAGRIDVFSLAFQLFFTAL